MGRKEQEIHELQDEINNLPKGSVTKKMINNTYYYYHQWKDASGKRHYDIVTEIEFFELKEQIQIRRELEKRLRALVREFESHGKKDWRISPSTDPEIDLRTNAMFGEELSNMVSMVRGLGKRDCYNIVEKYTYEGIEDKVCLLFGLRRTGKTTIIRQIIYNMTPEDFAKAVYIKAKQSDTIADINKDLKTLRKYGFRYIFVDEVTLISDFIDSAAIFSDVYAAGGMKIILSGTDSLGLYFASNEELYDRAVTVHTTYIPFREHARLLKIDSVDEYIRFGGTLKAGELGFENDELNSEEASFRDDESTRRYIDTAICKNIQHSLSFYEGGGHFRHLKKLYASGELTNAINRVVQDMNHEFTREVILKRFVSRDLRSAAQLLRSATNEEARSDALDEIDVTEIVEKLKKILGIMEKEELKENISQEAIEEIKEYLSDLDLIEEEDVEAIHGSVALDRNSDDSADELKRIMFTQPGMRYCQAEALVYSLMRSQDFKALSERDKLLITHKILEDVRGIMLEDIVFLETKKTLPGTKKVFKLQFDVGEFDMVIYDSSTNTCEVYEVKHSGEKNLNQLKHLLREDFCELTERKYGRITGKILLYNGTSDSEVSDNGCRYVNVVEYLKEL